MVNGLRAYKKDEYYLGYRDCYTKWVINDEGLSSIEDGCPVYSTMEDDDTIPTPYGWKYGGRNDRNENIIVAPVNSIYYSRKVFYESDLNNGSFNDTILVRYIYPINGSLSGSNGENFVLTGKVIITNLPTGLSLAMYRTSDNTLNAVLTGATSQHKYDLFTIGISFQNTAFTHSNSSSVKYATRNDMCLIFLDRILVKDGTSYPVNGIYKKVLSIDGYPVYAKGIYRLGYRGCNTQWVITNRNNDYSVSRGECPIYGTSISSPQPYFNEGWQNSNNLNEVIEVQRINSLQYSLNGFKECRIYHDGRISMEDTLVITYRYPDNNATFTGANGEDFVALNKAVITNLPAGLTMHLIRSSDSTLYANITGRAVDHSTDIFNLTVTFHNNAFSHNDTGTVYNTSKNDLTINFVSVYTVASTGADFNTVSSAVSSPIVEDGDILMLADETFTVSNQNINKDLTLVGQGPGKTILQPSPIPGTGNSRIFYLDYSDITIENLTLRNANYSSSYGGAIYKNYGNLVLKNCELYDNRNTYVNARAGAVYSYYGNLYIENCTFSNNRTQGTSNSSSYGGGALYIYQPNNQCEALIVNSTFYGNYSHAYGGGIWSYGNTDLINTTITGDTAFNGGGGYYRNGYTTTVTNTIIANNIAPSGPDCYNSINGNYSLISNNSSGNINGNNNLINVDPEVQSLTDNGGLTRTCAIPVTSPAKNAGTDVGSPLYDQRGAVRPDTTDIGAYEYNGVIPTITTATSLGGPYIVSTHSFKSLDVPYSITGSFDATNIFYAYISGPDSSWAGEKAIGELQSTGAGTIASIIDSTNLKSGVANYLVRVKSTDPAITGSESEAITINFIDQYIYPAADQITNITENGDTLRVYESQTPDSRVWMYGTTSGVYNQACGSTDTLYVPNFTTGGTYYVVCISTFGGVDVTSNEVVITTVVPDVIVNSVMSPPFRVNAVIADNGTIDYTAVGRFTSNTFTAYISDANGDFGAETAVGSLVSNVSGTINISISAGTPSGTGYKLRIKSTGPAITGAASDSFAIVFDTVPPTPILTSSASSYVNDTITLEIDFEEPVTGLGIEGLTLDNCTASNLSTIDSIVYTVKLIAENEGAFTAQVDSAAANDKLGLANLESAVFTRTYDITKPSVLIISSESDTTILYPFEVEIRFNENVSEFEIGDIEVSNATIDNFTETQSDRRWTVDVYASSIDDVEIEVSSGAAVDRAGNSSLSATPFIIFYNGTVDFEELSVNERIRVFPNPTDGMFTIQLKDKSSITLIITDITGKVILNKQIHSTKNEIDLSTCPQGVYFLQINSENSVDNLKLILK